jgi:hypothetical protein
MCAPQIILYFAVPQHFGNRIIAHRVLYARESDVKCRIRLCAHSGVLIELV